MLEAEGKSPQSGEQDKAPQGLWEGWTGCQAFPATWTWEPASGDLGKPNLDTGWWLRAHEGPFLPGRWASRQQCIQRRVGGKTCLIMVKENSVSLEIFYWVKFFLTGPSALEVDRSGHRGSPLEVRAAPEARTQRAETTTRKPDPVRLLSAVQSREPAGF